METTIKTYLFKLAHKKGTTYLKVKSSSKLSAIKFILNLNSQFVILNIEEQINYNLNL